MDISKITLMRRAGLLLEGQRIAFNGTKVDQLYNIVRGDGTGDWEVMVFANGKHYAISTEEMRSNLQNPVIIGMDEDGKEHEIRVSDIEFIKS